jgi:hypothetical protein
MTEDKDVRENNLPTLINALETQLSEHINRGEKSKLWKDTLIPVFSLIVALAGIIASMVVQIDSLRSQTNLKQYEVTFIAKQKAYSDFMATTHNMFFVSTEYSKDAFFSNSDKLQSQTFAIQPFLIISEQDKLWQDVQEITQICLDRFKLHQAGEKNLDESMNNFLVKRNNLRLWLSLSLFQDNTMSERRHS